MINYDYVETNNSLDQNHPQHLSFGRTTGDVARLRKNIERIDTFLDSCKEKLKPQARYAQTRKVAYELLDYQKPISGISQENLNRYCAAMSDMSQLAAVVDQHQHLNRFTHELRAAFMKDALLDIPGGHTPGRDMLFQYYCSARFKAAGCENTEGEPDIVCTFEDLTFGVAAKRCLHANLVNRVTEAASQIKKNCSTGVICVDLSQSSPFRQRAITCTHDEYTIRCGNWLKEKFIDPLNQELQKSKIDHRCIPFIIGFHLAVHRSPANQICERQNAVILGINPNSRQSPDEFNRRQTLHRVIARLRSTLPGG